MMNILARFSNRLAARLQAHSSGQLGKLPFVRALGSQAAASHEDSNAYRWAALVGLTGAFMPSTSGCSITDIDSFKTERLLLAFVLIAITQAADPTRKLHSNYAGALVTGTAAFASQADALEQEQKKTKIVILSTGWGATSFLNALKLKKSKRPPCQAWTTLAVDSVSVLHHPALRCRILGRISWSANRGLSMSCLRRSLI